MGDIEDIIRFGTAISWFTSLVPVHVTDHGTPLGFRTFDQELRFLPNETTIVDSILDRVREMRREGYLLYDSDQFLDDVACFIRGKPITWRQKNNNVCDSPNLYFALLPNGEFAPCCDHRLTREYAAYDPEFPTVYNDYQWRSEVLDVTSKCEGCMYGSYPEMTIAMRFLRAKIQRLGNFFAKQPNKDSWPLSYERLEEIAETIRREKRARPSSRQPPMRTIKIKNA